MAKITRRQFVASVGAVTTYATVGICKADAPDGALVANSELGIDAYADRIQDIGPAWMPIVITALEKMIAVDPALEVLQIKQKLGGLRIYYRSDYFEDLEMTATQAEIQCAKTCEICGDEGRIVIRDGWIRTLCENH